MAEEEKKRLEHLAEITNMLPEFEKGRLYGYATRMIEERERKEEQNHENAGRDQDDG